MNTRTRLLSLRFHGDSQTINDEEPVQQIQPDPAPRYQFRLSSCRPDYVNIEVPNRPNILITSHQAGQSRRHFKLVSPRGGPKTLHHPDAVGLQDSVIIYGSDSVGVATLALALQAREADPERPVGIVNDPLF